MIRQTLLLCAILAFAPVVPVRAIGLGDWEIQTPGRSFIGNGDYHPSCGVCLTSRRSDSDLSDFKLYASSVEWWQYYPGYISGQAKEGLFLFDESRKTIRFFQSQAELEEAIASQNLKPTAQPMTPQDGWNQVWQPILERCQREKC